MSADDNDLTLLWVKFRAESGLSVEEQREIDLILKGIDTTEIPIALVADLEGTQPAVVENTQRSGTDVRKIVEGLSVPKKIKLAMSGNKSARSVLVSDSNRLVQLGVLKNPKLSTSEIQEYVANPQVDEYILRAVANSNEWTRDYSIKRALVRNPKTPLDISLKWIRHLNTPDLKNLARSKGIPQVLSVTAKRILQDLAKRS